MNLHDYAAGNLWCKNGFEGAQSYGKATALSGSRQTTSQHTRATTAPCWRKPRQQRVDEKVQKLLEGYQQVDISEKIKMARTDSERRTKTLQKYFPEKDVPLGQLEQSASEDETNGMLTSDKQHPIK